MNIRKKESITDGLLQKAAESFAALGVPGLIVIVALELTGLAGAAALTTTLAAVGGPFGMIGGVVVFGLLVLGAKALTHYGIEKLGLAIIRKLIENGESHESIRLKVEQYPRYLIKSDLRGKILELLCSYGRESEPPFPKQWAK